MVKLKVLASYYSKIPKLPYTLCYVSRGFVADYNNKEVLEALLSYAKEVARDEKSYAIKIDPDVEVDKGAEALKIYVSLGLNIKVLKKDYLKTIFNQE